MLTLGAVAPVIAARVTRDASFATLGFLQHNWPDRLSFVETEAALERLVVSTGISCVLCPAALEDRVPRHLGVAVADSPRQAFCDLHEHLASSTDFYGRVEPTTIATSAQIHERAFVALSGVRIAAGVRIEPNATILEGADIGEGSVIRAGVIVGSEGFQVSVYRGRARRLTHAGSVVIGADVEIQSGCCIDRALFGGATRIGDATTLDKLVYVAHHVVLGRGCRIGAGALLTGSVQLGDEVWVGPNATLRDGVTVGDRAQISLGSVVTRDVEADAHVTGNFARPHDQFLAGLRRDRSS